MPYANRFPTLPDEARLWIYAADHPLTDDEQRALADALGGFAEGWTSHGRPVRGAVEIAEGRFLLVAATLFGGDPESEASPKESSPGQAVSGCGIDASVHAIEDAGRRLGIAWLSALYVFYRTEGGTVESASRAGFRARVEAGGVTTQTPVFDPTVQTVGALRGGAFEKPAGQSWHRDAFLLPEPA